MTCVPLKEFFQNAKVFSVEKNYFLTAKKQILRQLKLVEAY